MVQVRVKKNQIWERFSKHFLGDRSFTLFHFITYGDTWSLEKQFMWGHSAGTWQRRGWGLGSTAPNPCLLTLAHGHLTDEETKAQNTVCLICKSSRNPGNQKNHSSHYNVGMAGKAANWMGEFKSVSKRESPHSLAIQSQARCHFLVITARLYKLCGGPKGITRRTNLIYKRMRKNHLGNVVK